MTPGGRWAIIGTVCLVLIGAATLVILAITGDLNTNATSVMTIITLIVTTVPGLIAAGFAKQAAHDIRNGVVTDKAAEGAVKALQQTGVTDVVEATAKGASTVLAMNALAKLLETNTAAVTRATENTNPPEGGNTHG